jgi:S1-C subfamily serine protease
MVISARASMAVGSEPLPAYLASAEAYSACLLFDHMCGEGRWASWRPKDVILAVNGERLKRACQLPRHSLASLPGDVLRLAIQRGKKQLTIDVTVQQPTRAE